MKDPIELKIGYKKKLYMCQKHKDLRCVCTRKFTHPDAKPAYSFAAVGFEEWDHAISKVHAFSQDFLMGVTKELFCKPQCKFDMYMASRIAFHPYNPPNLYEPMMRGINKSLNWRKRKKPRILAPSPMN
jgi:hypothetical protein